MGPDWRAEALRHRAGPPGGVHPVGALSGTNSPRCRRCAGSGRWGSSGHSDSSSSWKTRRGFFRRRVRGVSRGPEGRTIRGAPDSWRVFHASTTGSTTGTGADCFRCRRLWIVRRTQRNAISPESGRRRGGSGKSARTWPCALSQAVSDKSGGGVSGERNPGRLRRRRSSTRASDRRILRRNRRLPFFQSHRRRSESVGPSLSGR